jgi:amidohydrolase
MAADVLDWWRHLHRHPELSYHEEETARFVAERLALFGDLEIERPTPFSVVARLRGARPGRCLAIRADLDALPVSEETGLPFASQRPGIMHACGHDGHTAILLGAARVLTRQRQMLSGEVRFVFQHAEEVSPGGAQELVDLGVLEGADYVIGLHLWLSLPAGKIGIAAGPLTAAPDSFRARIVGRGGHAAQPHLNVDPIPVAAEAILALQQIASRRVDPRQPIVVSVTEIHAGTADNVTPDEVTLAGTVRTYSPQLQAEAQRLIAGILQGIAQAHGASSALEYVRGYRPVVNDPWLATRLHDVFVELLGEGSVQVAEPSMVGEDFSAYQQVVPGCFFWLGARNEAKGIVYPHHHPRFTVDEDVLPLGVAALAAAALRLLGETRR